MAASLAVAAATAGEKVIALDLDPQGSLTRWGQRRAAMKTVSPIMVEPFERDRLPRLGAILAGLAGTGFTLAIFDTAGADSSAVSLVAEAADLCLLPSRPTRLDVEATAMTFRAAFLAKRKAAFVLNQCPPNYRSARASDAAKDLTSLGVLAEPLVSARMDYQDALARGFGVTEFSRDGRAAREIEELWRWSCAQTSDNELPLIHPPAANQNTGRVAAA